MRLVDGENACEGRLEVLYQGRWGIVCDDLWDIQDAHVVCRQIGCGAALAAPGAAQFGQGSSNYILDDVNCTGRELRLDQCSHRGWGVHNCVPSEVAGVICSGILELLYDTSLNGTLMTKLEENIFSHILLVNREINCKKR